MTSIVKLQKKGQLTIPNQMRDRIGLAEGDYVQVVNRGNKIILEPAQVTSRTAADELTPAQKRALDARLAKGLADVKAGRLHGPFSTHEAFISSLHKAAKRLNKKKTKRAQR